MKIYDKKEAAPDSGGTNQPPVKSVLLQTYFTSLFSLVLCVIMFFGTSYAWFTSEVSNANNEIYIGILDVELKKLDKKVVDKKVVDDWESLSETEKDDKGNEVNKTTLFDDGIRWEPGYTAFETVKVVNEGDLSFQYMLTFTDGNVTDRSDKMLDDGDWEDVAEHFDVWVYDHGKNNGKEPDAEEYNDIDTNNGWVCAGSLDEILSGEKSVLGGTIIAEQGVNTLAIEEESNGEESDGEKNAASAENADIHTIALHMKEEADTSVMGHKISLSVKLIAYQMGNEMVTTVDQLEKALEKGGTVALAADIDLGDGHLTVPEDVSVVLDLNGHDLTKEGSAGDSVIKNNGTLTVMGKGKVEITFDGDVDNSKAVNAISNRGTLTINGGNISSIWAQNPSKDKASEVEGTVIINGGNIEDVYYENYTNVKVRSDIEFEPTPYWSNKPADKDYTVTESTSGEYTVYTMKPISQ